MTKFCKLKGCNRQRNSKGLCRLHARKLKKWGNSLISNSGIREKRFWSKIDIKSKDECWEWLGGKDKDGYGKTSLNYKDKRVTHVVWFYTHGVFPKHQMLHLCDNPPCSNPNHLYDGTNQDNINDKVNKHRHLHGESHPLAKLNENDVLVIRDLISQNFTLTKIAKQYDVTIALISAIKRGIIWKHVT